MREHGFVVKAASSELFEVLAPAYRAWVTESMRDDELCGGPQDALAMASYPALNELQGNPNLLELVIGHYLLHDFLGKFTWDGTSTIKYWFDRITGCQIADGVVVLTGACYSDSK